MVFLENEVLGIWSKTGGFEERWRKRVWSLNPRKRRKRRDCGGHSHKATVCPKHCFRHPEILSDSLLPFHLKFEDELTALGMPPSLGS